MKSSMYLKNMPVFMQILLAFLVVIVPLYAMTANANHLGAKNVEQEISRTMEGQTGYYMEILESEMSRILSVQAEYLKDEDVLELSHQTRVMSEEQYNGTIINIEKRIRLLKILSSYIDEVMVYIMPINKKISTSHSIESLTLEEKDTFKEHNSLLDPSLMYWVGEEAYLSVPFSKKYWDQDGERPLFSINIRLSLQELKSQLERFTINEGGSTLLYSRSGGWTMAGTRSRYASDDMYKAIEGLQLGSSGTDTIFIHGDKYMIAYAKSDSFDTTLVLFLPYYTVFRELNTYRIQSWVILFISLLVILLFSIEMRYLIVNPLSHIIKGFKHVEQGDLTTLISHQRRDEFGYLFDRFNDMVLKLKTSLEEKYEEKIRTQQAELKQLQYQINPHFLYNSLFLINRMSKLEDYENISHFTNHLGKYYQYLTSDNDGYITLNEEMNHAKSYIEIQTMRFGERIRVEFKNPPIALNELRVPRLLLQPILENAYEHGMGALPNAGLLRVTSYLVQSKLVVAIEDNGNLNEQHLNQLNEILSAPSGDMQKGTGMINVHRRLRIHFGGGSGLSVSRSELGGLKVSLIIEL